MILQNIHLFSNCHDVLLCALSLKNKKTTEKTWLSQTKPMFVHLCHNLMKVFIPNSGHNWEQVLLEPNFNSELLKNAAKHTQKYGKLKDAHHAREGDFQIWGLFLLSAVVSDSRFPLLGLCNWVHGCYTSVPEEGCKLNLQYTIKSHHTLKLINIKGEVSWVTFICFKKLSCELTFQLLTFQS